ncbi:glycosyltransferase [Marinicella meishanensis]|uniref:glycosyltransferase n=1 Tax=Marinicella meishanensis TaxID=2873263 RepID=UPI001CBE0409|nr:glycosyltransferase [Marinicella sp. NBU2979]
MVPSAPSSNEPALTVMQVLPQLKVGGVERGTIEFAQYLKRQGHQPLVVSAGGPLVGELVTHDITHINLEVGKKSLTTLRAVKQLRRLMRDWQVDVVHARSRLPAWLCLRALQGIKHHRPKLVTTLHGLHSVNRYSSIMARGDRVIAVSETALAYLQRNFKRYLQQPPVLIYRGVDPQFKHGHSPNSDWLQHWQQQHPHAAKRKKVLLPGRLTAIKGVKNLLHWLRHTAVDCQLLLTAQADQSSHCKKIKQLFDQHQLSDRVSWLGVERQIANLYALADVVVSVNEKPESFGRTVLEALTIGTPVVAFAHGGVAEVMQAIFPEGQVEPGDVVTLAARIDEFLQHPPTVEPHGLFANDTLFSQTLAVYQGLLRDSRDSS